MNTMIDSMETFTGWSASGTAALYLINEYPDFIACDKTGSLVFAFAASGDYVKKTLSPAVMLGANNRLTLSLWSQKQGNGKYEKYTDFKYKIELGTGKVYYLPAYSLFTDVTLDVSDISTIETIKITYLGDTPDFLLVSAIIISKDELPFDLLFALKDKFESYFIQKHENSYPCGVIRDAEAGDAYIEFKADPAWIKRYSKIAIIDGSNIEYHHVATIDGKRVTFTSYYDGSVLLNDMPEDTAVYMCIPSEFGRAESEIVLPSINIWGLSPEPMDMESDVEVVLDTWKSDGTVNESEVGKWYKYTFLIDCESGGNMELLVLASEIVRVNLERKSLWVNGKQCLMNQLGAPASVEVIDVVNNIPKIQYTCEILVKEEIWDKVRLPITVDVNITATPNTILL